jgi:hypothetical protein
MTAIDQPLRMHKFTRPSMGTRDQVGALLTALKMEIHPPTSHSKDILIDTKFDVIA